MNIQAQLLTDIQKARKQKDPDRLSDLSYLLGEFNRQAKQVADEQARGILQKIKKNEESLGSAADQRFIELIESYLPAEATDQEITEWINQNIDFSAYKNRMQAMREILAAFAGRADGKRVKDLLSGME